MSTPALLVDCHKIINWLDDRKKLQKDWYNFLKGAQQKTKTLIKQSQWTYNYQKLRQIIQNNNQNFTFLQIQQFVDILITTDLAQKNLLFGYSDKRVKQWTVLKKYMEKNNLMILSVAKFIQQSLRFQLPALSKSVQGLDSQLLNLKRKIDFNKNTIFQLNNQITKEKATLGVQNENQLSIPIDQLVKILINRAPQQITKFQHTFKSSKLSNFINQYNNKTQNQHHLQFIQYLLENGDQFEQVYKDKSQKQKYRNVVKYNHFATWRQSSIWEISITGNNIVQQNINFTTIIQSRQFRQNLYYDLNQLLFFYKGQKHQLISGKGLGLQNNNNLVEGQIDNAIKQIQNIIYFLNSKKLTSPLQFRGSKNAYQGLIDQFTGSQKSILQMQKQIINYQNQISQIQIKRAQEAQKLVELRGKVKKSKVKCESWLTDLVKRQVKITGEINKLD